MQAGVAPEAVAAMEALRAAFDRFAAADLSRLSKVELLGVMDEYEAFTCQIPAPTHRMLAALQGLTSAVAMGAKNYKQVLATRWRISTAEAGRRLAAAKTLGSRQAVSGEPLEPELAAVAAAQKHGVINAEHIAIIRRVVATVRARVDTITAAQLELELVRTAVTVGPKELEALAAQRLAELDQDGPEPDDRERNRRRAVKKGKQRSTGTTPITVEATPALAASLGVLFAKFAAPGMCNPDDPEPCVSGTPSQGQIDGDHRSLEQRQHDALEVMARIALESDLGTLNGLPVSVLVKTTLQDLQAMAGVAAAGDGTTMSIRELIRLGAHAYWSLAVFDGADGSALDLFRTRRVASPAQRLMLIAREWGCTKPGCPVGPYGCQVHHAVADWSADGNTNVDELALACGPDNRLVGPGPDQWSTDVVDGVAHWQPPEDLDTGQATINYRNRPELIPLPDENAPLPWESTPAPPTPPPSDTPDTAPPEPEPVDPVWAFGDDAADAATVASPARKWTDAEHAAFDARYPNGPFADYPEDPDAPAFPAPPRRWTDAEEAAFNARYPNGPFADYPDGGTLPTSRPAAELEPTRESEAEAAPRDDDAPPFPADRPGIFRDRVTPDAETLDTAVDDTDYDPIPPPPEWFEHWEPGDIPDPEPPDSRAA